MRIVALGSWAERPVQDYILGLTGSSRPRILYVPTAGREDPEWTLSMYDIFRDRADVSHVTFFPWPPEDLRERTLSSDVIWVAGGNTANMLAIWRVHGFDELLREAWENDVLLTGWSAGAICWFDACVTDSFGPQLEGIRDGLRLLPGSACPHYDSEERRRSRYTELVRGGFPEGIAIDDDAGVRYDGTALAEVVSSREGATAYRVTANGEERLEARLLA